MKEMSFYAHFNCWAFVKFDNCDRLVLDHSLQNAPSSQCPHHGKFASPTRANSHTSTTLRHQNLSGNRQRVCLLSRLLYFPVQANISDKPKRSRSRKAKGRVVRKGRSERVISCVNMPVVDDPAVGKRSVPARFSSLQRICRMPWSIALYVDTTLDVLAPTCRNASPALYLPLAR